jgi:hypothetical protein
MNENKTKKHKTKNYVTISNLRNINFKTNNKRRKRNDGTNKKEEEKI